MKAALLNHLLFRLVLVLHYASRGFPLQLRWPSQSSPFGSKPVAPREFDTRRFGIVDGGETNIADNSDADISGFEAMSVEVDDRTDFIGFQVDPMNNTSNDPSGLTVHLNQTTLEKETTSSQRSPAIRPQEKGIPFFAEEVKAIESTDSSKEISRRKWLEQGAMVLFSGAIASGGLVAGPSVQEKPVQSKSVTGSIGLIVQEKPMHSKPAASTNNSGSGRLAPVNITTVAAETKINVSLDCEKGCISVDPKNFTKIQSKKVPTWYPAFLIPPPKVIKEITNAELLTAATIAGATTEMFRTSLLYPLQTIKTRIQTDVHNATKNRRDIEDRLKLLGTNLKKRVVEGNLYAGIKPTLLISVPATGVYFGVRDVSKRALGMLPFLNDVEIVLSAALIADIMSLCFRTPADALALRLQKGQSEAVGDWLGDSLKRLPSVIITDLPYLLSKILLGKQFIQGNISMDRYAEFAIFSAVIAAFLTTPFDVARTRILVDSDGDFSNGIDGGSGDGVLETMVAITKEGEGGLANLFAGWLERVLYLGLGRAWLEPIQIIAYVGIRDTLLLEWF